MSKIAFFGAADGLAKSLSTVASKAGFTGSIQATTSVADFAELAKANGSALGGPAAYNNAEIASELGIHSRVLRAFGAANIPKPRDLYRGASFTVILPSGPVFAAESIENLSLADAANLSSAKVHRDAFTAAAGPVAEFAAATAAAAGSNVTFASLNGEDATTQKIFLAAVKKALPADFPIVQVALPNVVNELIISPQNIGTVIIAPSFASDDALSTITGLLGGDGVTPVSLVGDKATVHVTGPTVADSANGNFYSSALALCELLASSNASTADKLYNGLRKAAEQGCTYEAAAAGKLVARVSAAI